MTGSTSPQAAGTPGFVRALIQAGVHIEVGERTWEAAASEVPARAGVVAVEDGEGRTLLLGTTADARAFVVKRCAPASAAEGKRADLGEIARRVAYMPVASGFEADLVYLAMARERTPAAYGTLMARWGVWVVRLDAEDEFPEAMPLALKEGGRYRPASLMGPVSEMWASRLMGALVDAFDLCRYPHILKQAPRGVACAYKEMGRCPGPCDGTEAMASYRDRVRRAVECVGRREEDRGAELLVEIRRAASESRFEDAAALKKVLERLRALDASGLRGVTTMDRFRHVVVARTGKRGVARAFGWVGGALEEVIDAGPKDVGAFERLASETASAAVGFSSTPEEADGVVVLSRWLAKAGTNRMVRVVRLGGADDAREVMAAARSVTRVGGKETAEEVEETEHGDPGGVPI